MSCAVSGWREVGSSCAAQRPKLMLPRLLAPHSLCCWVPLRIRGALPLVALPACLCLRGSPFTVATMPACALAPCSFCASEGSAQVMLWMCLLQRCAVPPRLMSAPLMSTPLQLLSQSPALNAMTSTSASPPHHPAIAALTRMLQQRDDDDIAARSESRERFGSGGGGGQRRCCCGTGAFRVERHSARGCARAPHADHANAQTAAVAVAATASAGGRCSSSG